MLSMVARPAASEQLRGLGPLNPGGDQLLSDSAELPSPLLPIVGAEWREAAYTTRDCRALVPTTLGRLIFFAGGLVADALLERPNLVGNFNCVSLDRHAVVDSVFVRTVCYTRKSREHCGIRPRSAYILSVPQGRPQSSSVLVTLYAGKPLCADSRTLSPDIIV